MPSVKPWGNIETATILIIGHDPRLQKSLAEAEHAFFFEYLESPRPTYGPDAAKYDLAKAVWDYICNLAGRPVPLNQLYITNLCNRYLPHASGSVTVLIPDADARLGLKDIELAVAHGHLKLILPMSVQVLYHLCRLDFVKGNTDLINAFLSAACPREGKAQQGLYQPKRNASFLQVCGQPLNHKGIPVIPIVHVKQWPLKQRFIKYTEPMNRAKQAVSAAIGAD